MLQKRFFLLLFLLFGTLVFGQGESKYNKKNINLSFLVEQLTYFNPLHKVTDNYTSFKPLYTNAWGWNASLKFDYNQHFLVEFGYGNSYHHFNFWRSFPFNAPFEDSIALSPSQSTATIRREYIFGGLGIPFNVKLQNNWDLQLAPSIQLYRYTENNNDSVIGEASYEKWPYNDEREYFLYSQSNIAFNGSDAKHYDKLSFVPTIRMSASLLWFIPKWNRLLRLQFSYGQTLAMKQPESKVDFKFYNTDGSLIKHLTYKSYMRSLGISLGVTF